MKLDFLIDFILFAISITVSIAGAACNRSCGDKTVPYPFGFSAACRIHLNCTSNGTILASDFPVQSFDGATISVSLPPVCGRPVEAIRRLFTDNFAPTSQNNAILLQDCGSKQSAAAAASKCFIPQTMVQTHFDLLDCGGGGGNISCYSEADNRTSFIDYGKLTRSGCRSLFSAISMEAFANSSAVSLEIQIVRVGWWLSGGCRCSENAMCVTVSPPAERSQSAYRCECLRGFEGDGFREGFGCRKESLTCDPSKYISGQCGGTTRFGVLIGGVAAGAFLMVTLGLISCFIRKRSKLRTTSRKCHQLSETTGITVPVYPYNKMEKATDFFSDKRRIGHGAYGTVYAGKLTDNDQWVAIKRIKQADPASIGQVINEVKLLSSVSHPNLLRLLGCSMKNDEQILVYEFMPNGTLSQHLQRERGNGISWPLRLAIAVETAQAIAYLHNAMHPPIYHRDVKSSNILLDFDFRSKVADFGLSRLGLTESSAHISTAPQGTPGYVDPQYHQHFQLSDRSDVYSFGVVLMEIITGMQAVDFARPPNEVNLAALAVDRIGRGHLDEILDPFLEPDSDAWTLTSVHKVAELGFRCLAFHSDMRPSMMEVAEELEQISVVAPITSRLSRLSSASDPRDKQLNGREFDSACLFGGKRSMDMEMESSPCSGEDTCQSDLSTPSSSSLLCQAALPGKS